MRGGTSFSGRVNTGDRDTFLLGTEEFRAMKCGRERGAEPSWPLGTSHVDYHWSYFAAKRGLAEASKTDHVGYSPEVVPSFSLGETTCSMGRKARMSGSTSSPSEL